MFDIVIPVSYKDCRFLHKTVKMVRRNIPTAGTIYVITARVCFSEFPDKFRSTYRVELIDENKLLPEVTFASLRQLLAQEGREDMTGWYFQQFLKMGFAESQYAGDYYLVWDADTLPLHKLTFFEGDRILFNPKKEHHTPYFDTITRLLGIVDFAPQSYISEHLLFSTFVMQEMLKKIAPTAKGWTARILTCCDLKHQRQAFSEFETYGNYCRVFHPTLMCPRQLMSLRCGGRLFGRQVTEKEIQMLALDFDTASFERGQYPSFPRSLRSKWERAVVEITHRLRKLGN